MGLHGSGIVLRHRDSHVLNVLPDCCRHFFYALDYYAAWLTARYKAVPVAVFEEVRVYRFEVVVELRTPHALNYGHLERQYLAFF
jgi:hypothetical protein